MFVIEDNPEHGAGIAKKIVVDHDRQVSLQFFSGVFRTDITCFKLVWENRIIPFNALEKLTYIHRGPIEVGLVKWKIEQFGCSDKALSRGLAAYAFQSAAEEETALQLATEALQVYGRFYDGDQESFDVVKVEYRGRILLSKEAGAAEG